jgi:hypothetical protein
MLDGRNPLEAAPCREFLVEIAAASLSDQTRILTSHCQALVSAVFCGKFGEATFLEGLILIERDLNRALHHRTLERWQGGSIHRHATEARRNLGA